MFQLRSSHFTELFCVTSGCPSKLEDSPEQTLYLSRSSLYLDLLHLESVWSIVSLPKYWINECKKCTALYWINERKKCTTESFHHGSYKTVKRILSGKMFEKNSRVDLRGKLVLSQPLTLGSDVDPSKAWRPPPPQAGFLIYQLGLLNRMKSEMPLTHQVDGFYMAVAPKPS